jgi:hypothetical protein
MDGNNCPTPTDSKYCLKPSNGNTLNYTNLSGTSFKLIATKDTTSYYITSDTSPNNKNLLNIITGNDSASFEDGTTSGWENNGATQTIDITTAWHGSRCIKGTIWGTNLRIARSIITITSAGAQYTLSAWVKGDSTSLGDVATLQMYGNASGTSDSTGIALTTDWQRLTLTKTFSASDTTTRYAYVKSNGAVGHIFLIDAIQLESGSVATPF